MGTYAAAFGPHAPERTYVPHAHQERLVDLGEVHLNHVIAGDPALPPLLLVPGQTESWWGYEGVLPSLAEHFHVAAVDLRGQGRSTRTPGRYTLDNIGNDLVRFVDAVFDRPAIVAGLSSGGVITAWLAAYAPPGRVRAAYIEDAPLFASEVRPAIGPGIDQCIGPVFRMFATYLGDQWAVGDWDGMAAAAAQVLPPRLALAAALFGVGGEPPQQLKEYDPEWGRAFTAGTFAASCDHERMLAAVRVPVLLTHHLRAVDPATGALLGAISDLQVAHVERLVTGAGNSFTYRSFPQLGHSLHGQDPALYVETLLDWVAGLPA